MACNYPLTVYQDRDGGPVSFFERAGMDQLSVPCGRCAGCRLGRAQAWALRCQHEASLHDENCFLTLTYDDEEMPVVARGEVTPRRFFSTGVGTLHYPHVQKFIRSLRKEVAPKRFSFLCAGEYGERTNRPHYHVLLFGHRFERSLDFSRAGVPGRLGESPALGKWWPYGNHFVGELTVQSASYVSQYCLKKVYGRAAVEFYDVVDVDTGEVLGRRVPEFLRMSLRPAIGRKWYEKFSSDVFPVDYAVSSGVRSRVPRYYEKLFRRDCEAEFEEVEWRRQERMESSVESRSVERRSAREEILRARIARNAERRKV